MSEEAKSMQERASSPKFSSVFLKPNLINMAAAVLMAVLMILMLIMPVFKVSTAEGTQLEGYSGDTEFTYSALDVISDVINEMDIEKDEGALATPENPGKFSQAVTLLVYQHIADYTEDMLEYQEQVDAGNADAQRPEEPQLNSRLGYVLLLAFPALAAVLAGAIVVLVNVIKAIKRFFVCKPYPKFNDNFGIVFAPTAIVVIIILMRFAATYFNHVHFVKSNLLVMLILGVVTFTLDCVCFGMAKNISKKHYPHQP